MALAHVDGVGDGQVVGDARMPVLFISLLGRQPVVEGGQPGALKRRAAQDVVAQDQAAGGRKAAQRVPCRSNHPCHYQFNAQAALAERGLSRIAD